MRIGILGTRGIPNRYGGFEKFAEKLSCGLVSRGHEVFVYNSHNHVYQENTWNGVQIIHCYDPEYLIGTAGQFVYDLRCIIDARKRSFDVILMLGYTSSSVWSWLLPSRPVIIYNMDGMEWQRAKYSKKVRKFLEYAEKWAVRSGDYHVADSPAIKSYLADKYGLKSEYIPYGASLFPPADDEIPASLGVLRNGYYMLMARMEPENNLETILDGFTMSKSDKKFLVVGNAGNHFGKTLVQKFRADDRILFTGAIYDEQRAHALRYHCHLYFHGHSTGGTNPSLLEAMASKAFIVAHDNIFNRMVLNENAMYFRSSEDIRRIIDRDSRLEMKESMISENLNNIKAVYNWEDIFSHYERFMIASVYSHRPSGNKLSKRLSWK
jgi:glycosyltransferase involved in cell wall biosynthesis